MAQYLVIDWDHQHLCIISATIRRRLVHIHKALLFQEENGLRLADADKAGRLLADRLKEAGIAPAPVLACVGRDRIILKDIRFPAVPPNEEPAVVRFQAFKEINDSPEESVIDYFLTGNQGNPGGERRALAVIVKREILATYQSLCRSAGLKLAALTPRPFGTGACLKHQLAGSPQAGSPGASENAVAVLTLVKPWAEFIVVHDGAVLYSRSLPISPRLPAEVRSNLAVFANQSPQEVAALYFAGDEENGEYLEGLKRHSEIPVYTFDPFAGIGAPDLPRNHGGAFAGAVGLLYELADQGGFTIDFVKPKEPRPRRNPNKKRLLAWAGLAGVALIGLAVYCFARLSLKEVELEALVQEKTDLDRSWGKLDEEGRSIKALDEWSQAGIVWLDEIYDLTDQFPDTESMRLIQLTGDPILKTAKGKFVARMALKGIATTDYQSIDKLVSRLVDGHHGVEPKVLGRNSGAERFRFPQQFSTRVEIEKITPIQYVRKIAEDPAIAAARAKNGGTAGDGLEFGSGSFGGDQP